MKKAISFILALILFLLPSMVVAEAAEEQALYEKYVENLKETDRTFTVPIGIGIIQSVIVLKDGIGVALAPIGGRAVSIGLQALDYLIDLKEVELHLENGQKLRFPAIAKIANTEVGSFVIVYITREVISSLAELISNHSSVVRLSFIQGDQTTHDMTMEELNQSFRKAFGETIDFIRQIPKAIAVFCKNLTEGIGVFAENTHAAIEKAVVDAGRYISEKWTDVGEALFGAAESAGKAVSGVVESAGKVLEDASEAISDFWNRLFGK